MFGIGGGNKFIGLDIGHSHLFAVRLKDGKPEEIGEYVLPKGIVDDGEVVNPEELTNVLKKFWKEEKLKTRNIHIAVASTRVRVAIIELPTDIKKDELKDAIYINISDKMPIDFENDVIDFSITDVTPDNHGRQKIVVAAAPKDLVMDYIKATRRAGLTLTGIQLLPFVLPNSIAIKEIENQEALTVSCNIGSEMTSVGIFYKDNCLFARFSGLAGDSITEAIVKKLDIPFAQAEEIKCRIGLAGHASNEEEKAAKEAIIDVIDSLGQEIYETTTYYLGEPESVSLPFSQVVLSGGSASLRGLPQYIEGLLGIDTEIAKPKEGIHPHEEDFYQRWATVYGLAVTNKTIEELHKPKKKKVVKEKKEKASTIPTVNADGKELTKSEKREFKKQEALAKMEAKKAEKAAKKAEKKGGKK